MSNLPADAQSTPRDVFAEFVSSFFQPLAKDLADPSVSEVLINGPFEVFVERKGMLVRSESKFRDEEQLMSALRAVSQFLNRPLSAEMPILEGRLPDGSRLQALVAPLAAGGPCVAIRRHKVDSLTLEQLIQWQAITPEASDLLRQCVARKDNILISGGTGSGKTSLLRCVASLIDRRERIVTIEDARELHLAGGHIVSLEARPKDSRGKGEVSIGDLFRATLRLRPDRIVIGELRGGEALDLIQAMTSGHGGCLSTVHASSPEDALRRVETMALYQGISLPLSALRHQIASAVDLIVQIERTIEGRRWVKAIAQVHGLSADGYYQTRVLMTRGEQGELRRIEDRG